jgi:RND superfamily putative drug exporter
LAALARWCFHHRTVVVLAWIAALVTLVAVERSVGNAYSTAFTLPGTESFKALNLLQSTLPKQAGDSATIVWHVSSGTVRDAATQPRIVAMLEKVRAAKSVAAVVSPYEPTGAAQISGDGMTAFATVDFTELAQNLPPEDIRHVMSLAQAARAPGLQIELGGNAIAEVNHTPPGNSVLFGIVAAALIILIAFG